MNLIEICFKGGIVPQRLTIIRKLDFSNFYKSIGLHQPLQMAQLAYGFLAFVCVPAWALVPKVSYYSRGCKSLVRGFVTRSTSKSQGGSL